MNMMHGATAPHLPTEPAISLSVCNKFITQLTEDKDIDRLDFILNKAADFLIIPTIAIYQLSDDVAYGFGFWLALSSGIISNLLKIAALMKELNKQTQFICTIKDLRNKANDERINLPAINDKEINLTAPGYSKNPYLIGTLIVKNIGFMLALANVKFIGKLEPHNRTLNSIWLPALLSALGFLVIFIIDCLTKIRLTKISFEIKELHTKLHDKYIAGKQAHIIEEKPTESQAGASEPLDLAQGVAIEHRAHESAIRSAPASSTTFFPKSPVRQRFAATTRALDA